MSNDYILLHKHGTIVSATLQLLKKEKMRLQIA